MAYGIRTGNAHDFNKWRSLKFREGYWVPQTPEECRRTSRSKRSENINKDEDNSLKTLNDKNIYLSINISIPLFESIYLSI